MELSKSELAIIKSWYGVSADEFGTTFEEDELYSKIKLELEAPTE